MRASFALLIEKGLSVDNPIVLLIIMSTLAVPKEYQQKVFLFGIAVALVMRAFFIAIGAVAISLFSYMFVVSRRFLIWTGIQLARHKDEDPTSATTGWCSSPGAGSRLVASENGQRVVTPLFLVFLAVGSTDLLFALDSIPAIFGITQDPYLVFTANAFALLGLRALYFLLARLLERLVYRPLGLAVILVFIGVKLILRSSTRTWTRRSRTCRRRCRWGHHRRPRRHDDREPRAQQEPPRAEGGLGLAARPPRPGEGAPPAVAGIRADGRVVVRLSTSRRSRFCRWWPPECAS